MDKDESNFQIIIEYDFKFDLCFGMWRSLVAHTHGVRGVAGSNPVIPTTINLLRYLFL